ncbi:MAG: hypothetical protein C0424_00100 [Sphingobacteriaceae bacterium]|nr:hypothetical protein [Sphingobacteriaceae bacterium]
MADDEVEAFFAAHARKIRRKGGIWAPWLLHVSRSRSSFTQKRPLYSAELGFVLAMCLGGFPQNSQTCAERLLESADFDFDLAVFWGRFPAECADFRRKVISAQAIPIKTLTRR